MFDIYLICSWFFAFILLQVTRSFGIVSVVGVEVAEEILVQSLYNNKKVYKIQFS